jgi:hypothetical protein
MERCPSEANVEKFAAVYVTLVFMSRVTGSYHWPPILNKINPIYIITPPFLDQY